MDTGGPSRFSRKFTPAQVKYSVYDRELTAAYEAVKHFRYYLEGREFVICTDHKPLIYALAQDIDTALPRPSRQLSYIAQFACKFDYVPGPENVVADSFSRVDAFRLPTQFDLRQLAQEQEEDEELAELLAKDNHGLKLQRLTWGPEQAKVYCEMSTDAIRPYLPKSLRERVFGLFHSVSHPGAKSSVRLVRQRYVWPHMHRDIARWCKNCLDCQKSKITRHNKLTPSQFVAPDGRFEHVHIDIVIMPDDGGYRYCLTMIDRFTRWPEAVPMRNMEASTVARVFYDTWVARFGAPTLITTDQGAQFESQLFDALLCLIGTKRMRTTAYHPQSNGLIERWHRDVKAAIMCHNKRWTKVLSTVLLGLRTRVRLETDVRLWIYCMRERSSFPASLSCVTMSFRVISRF